MNSGNGNGWKTKVRKLVAPGGVEQRRGCGWGDGSQGKLPSPARAFLELHICQASISLGGLHAEQGGMFFLSSHHSNIYIYMGPCRFQGFVGMSTRPRSIFIVFQVRRKSDKVRARMVAERSSDAH